MQRNEQNTANKIPLLAVELMVIVAFGIAKFGPQLLESMLGRL